MVQIECYMIDCMYFTVNPLHYPLIPLLKVVTKILSFFPNISLDFC